MKQHKEIIKTVAITILITANVSFLLGIMYANRTNSHIKSEVQSQITTLKAQLPEAKQ